MKVRLEYCTMWNYKPRAVSLTDKIRARFQSKVAALDLVPGSGGCFEISVDGKLIYSKLKTGQFPDEEKILTELATLAK